jgi:hypothetical protein
MDGEFRTYAFEYTHEGKPWMFYIKATSHEDAEARVSKLRWAKPVGELVATIPASAGWLGRAWCWARNLCVKLTR